MSTFEVLKFGGTSVGSAQRIREVATIVNDGNTKLVVLSAMSKTTNALLEISGLLAQVKKAEAREKINELHARYKSVVDELLANPEIKKTAHAFIDSSFVTLNGYTENGFNRQYENEIVALGEIWSTNLFTFYLKETGMNVQLINALDYMRIDDHSEPDMEAIRTGIETLVNRHAANTIYVTQGFICRNSYGNVDNLKRGGSDYTASIVGAALGVDEIQIWTDIDGMHNNDPRIVDKTHPVRELSFDEAAELAYFGAKILHPATIYPAREKNIPVRLKYTMEPKAQGTLITNKVPDAGIKAVAAKDNITVIKIRSSRMLMAYGFLRAVFEIFERYRTPIDMITTSEVAVSLTIDNHAHLYEIVNELKEFGQVDVETDQTIICIVGSLVAEKKGYAAEIFTAMKDIPIRMVSYGGSDHNVSVLIHSHHKKAALQALNAGLFYN
jgi:aspartate kinase